MKLLYTILLLLTDLIAHSQTGRLHGTVLNEKKEPMAGVVITFWNQFIPNGYSLTDSNGRYYFSPDHSYHMLISHPGYTTYMLWTKVEADINKQLNIIMNPGNDTLTGGILHLCKNPTPPTLPDIFYHHNTPPYITHTGLITDRHKNPITDAYIYAYRDTSLIQYEETDSTGMFALREQFYAGAMSAPNYLTITRHGYKPIKKLNISRQPSASQNITLRRKWWQSKK